MKKLRQNLMKKANIFSYITFWWMNDFFNEGSKHDMQESDMFELDECDTSSVITNKLERNWKKEMEKNKKPNLLRAIMRTYAFPFMLIGICAFLEESIRVAVPVLIGGLVRYFENTETTPLWHAYSYAAGISAGSLMLAFLHHVYFFHVQRIGWHMRASTCALMYKKTLRLSQKALGQTTTGQIVNLGATDVIRFDYFPMFLHYLWIGPVQCIVVAAILWNEVGVAILAGMAVLVSVMLMQGLIGRAFGKLRSLTAVITDERIRFMNEIIAGMRIIKMYTWEKPFAKLVDGIRRREVNKILLSSALRGINVTVFMTQEKILTFATLLVYIAIGGEISASKIFIVLTFFSITRQPIAVFFSVAIERFFETRAVTKRLQTYLLLDETAIPDAKLKPKSDEECYVQMTNYSGKWDLNDEYEESRRLTLENVTARVEAGKLLAVIGPVGSGKSSFLSAILKELPTTSGEIDVRGKITFANQIPWVFSGTVVENITFGEEYDPVWFKKVVKACALLKDLESLPNAERTLVGERGVTLSGGQKARVNLARAVYRKDASICLLDDPLSAVDAAVGNHIFQHCICGMLKDKVRILVTHQLQLLKSVDEIIILKEGQVAGKGTYDELQAEGTDFAALLKKKEDKEKEELFDDDIGSTELKLEFSSLRRRSSRRHKTSRQRTISRGSRVSIHSIGSLDIQEDYVPAEEPEELREQGSIGGRVYWEYFRVGANIVFLIFFILIAIASHVIFVMTDYWLALWATDYDIYKKQQLRSPTETNVTSMINSTDAVTTAVPVTTEALVEFDTSYYTRIYAALTAGMFGIFLLRAMMHFYLCVTSGIHMHKKMFRAILRSPIRFFDTNPVGRILNRFSKDMGQIDELLPLTFNDFLVISGTIMGSIILSVIINYFVLIVIFPLVIYFFWLRHFYLKTSRDIKRLEGTTRSPVFSLLSSTLQGLTTVRAFGVQDQFEEKFHQYQDLHSSAWYLFLCGSRWFGLRLDLISATFVSAIAMLSVLVASLVDLDAGRVGLTVTYSAAMLGFFQWGVRQSAEVENLMTSVERVQQYYRLPSEAADEVEDEKPPPEWPTRGSLKFENVSFAYYEDGPIVLKNVSFEIEDREKIGIVGRTGAGKSSLISALFRLAELTGGEIFIDGIPITPLGLNDLRKVISIIPQDPVLFTGTMRYNLDPFSYYKDEELWNALEQVQLKEVVESLPLKLSSELAESGSNFSVGQRQLVCLARAVLRKSKILVIDEATANVDLRTDRLIQLTIREKFKHCTVLTIAHRLNTIIDSDRVMVVDNGHVKEFDEPYVLLHNRNSMLSQFAEKCKGGQMELLRKLAKQAHDKREEAKGDL